MSENFKKNARLVNEFISKNQFWLEPLKILIIIIGFAFVINQKRDLIINQEKMMHNDSLRGLGQDSALINVRNLERTIEKLK